MLKCLIQSRKRRRRGKEKEKEKTKVLTFPLSPSTFSGKLHLNPRTEQEGHCTCKPKPNGG